MTIGRPDNVQAIVGETYSLTCTVTGGGTITPNAYRWFNNGSQLTSQTSATLSFSPLRQSDSGNYFCEGARSSVYVGSEIVRIIAEGKDAQ